MTMIPTIVQNPLLILTLNTLSPVSNTRASNIYQKCVHTKMKKRSVASYAVIGFSPPTTAENICVIEVTSAWFALIIELLYHSESRDRLAVLQQFAMYLINLRLDRFQILVQFQRFPVFPSHTSFGCVPTLFGNAALDLHFGTLSVYGDSQPDGCLAVFQ